MRNLRRCFVFCIILVLLSGCSKINGSGSTDEIPEVTVIQSRFTNGQDGSELLLSICKSEQSGPADELNMDALSVVIDFDKVILQDSFQISGYPCGIFSGDGISYACWTSSSKASGILEYNPDAVSEAEILKIIQSIFQEPEM